MTSLPLTPKEMYRVLIRMMHKNPMYFQRWFIQLHYQQLKDMSIEERRDKAADTCQRIADELQRLHDAAS
jgi:hypothetical protein